MEGWIKLHRKLIEKAFYSKDSEKVHLWVHLLLKANHSGYEEMLGGKPIHCNPGQFTTGRKQLARETGICESKVERILSYFEKTEQQIEQQKTSSNRLITVLRWDEYQETEQQIEQQVNNDRTTSEQQVNTLQECKNDKNEKNKDKESKRDAAKAATLKRREDFGKSLIPFMEKYPKEMIRAFFDYWSELNKSETKMRFEKQPTWEVSKRLATWANKENFNGNKKNTSITKSGFNSGKEPGDQPNSETTGFKELINSVRIG